ncbi:MAG: ATP-binding protein, partial [Propionibacteriaceae bacterium]|nr:ATP-binding protein [Propionibacteriaceae bacterium]
MTMLNTLFGMIPAASLGQQWLAEELQLVNWGGYDGAHRLRFSPAATLLCGGSGSGKSTLMDAYIALMMPHTTPFNGASNGGVSGRARGGEQRNILAAARGKLDESRTDDGTQVRVLRGDGADTWAAVAMTWVNHDRSRFTAVRAWYIPASARTLEEVTKVRAVCEGAFVLDGLEQAAAQRLTDAAVRAVGLETIATDKEFAARLHSVLGIGAAGSGAKAMGLLARIQAGQQITTVDELYKRMVLEEPETLAAADAVVSHFDELEATRQRMLTAQRQVRALSPIRDFRVRLEEAAERLRLIDEIGGFADPASLATLWRNRRRLALLRAAEAELRDRKASLDAEVSAQEGLAQAAGAERDALAEVVRSSGGARLENAERELAQVVRRLAEVRAARERFDEATACLGEPVGSREDFVALQRRAGQAIADAGARDTARRAHARAVSATDSLRQRLEELEQEHRVSRGRRGNIPTGLHECREQLARAAGLRPEELPFVGELIEVRTEYEPWREAFNLALGGFATTLLIDQAKLDGFRSAINTVRLPLRLRFEGVHTGHRPRPGGDPRRLPGRLDYADSVFTGWLQDRLEERFDYVCVDSASELGQHRKALTITGQLSQGSRGAHGGHGVTNVLGFSSQRRLDELAREIAAVRAQCERAGQAEREAAAGLDALEAQRAAYARVAESSWELIDVAGVEAEQARWERVRSEVMEANPEIAKLRRRIDELRAKE